MYDELMAEIEEGRYKAVAAVETFYAVDTVTHYLQVYPDGMCRINGHLDPDAPDFLQAIIDKGLQRAPDICLPMYDELMAEITGVRRPGFIGPIGPKQYYLAATGRNCLEVHPDGRCFINGVYAPDAPDFLQAIIEKCHEKALEMNDV